MRLKKLTIKGLYLGLIAGLTVTFFDGFFMICPSVNVPVSYPFMLMTFNVIFWTGMGGISGLALWLFVRNQNNIKEGFCWVLSFLLPFALVYGFLGRLYLPNGVLVIRNYFDHHLSFLWVLFFCSFLLYFFKKKGTNKDSTFTCFILEIATIIILFQYCTNIKDLNTIIPIDLLGNLKFAQDLFNLTSDQFLISVYTTGIVTIAVIYYSIFIAALRFKITALEGRHFFAAGILFVFVSISLTANFYLPSRSDDWMHSYPGSADQDKLPGDTSSVIVIMLDTVRRDRLSLYTKTQNNSVLTPNLEMLARDATVYENCSTSSPGTVPSHASLFTGLFPREHGSHMVLDTTAEARSIAQICARPLSDKFDTLAEIFRDRGYRTGAVIANTLLTVAGRDIHLNMNQGFQVYDCKTNIGVLYGHFPFRPAVHLLSYLTHLFPEFIMPYITADITTDKTIRLVDMFYPSPSFIFINYMDAHAPYNPPRPYDGYYLETSFPQFYRLKQYFLREMNRLDAASWNSYQLSQYDGGIAFIDYQLGRLFSYLKQKKLYDSSLIIVTSDHGELFGEHGLSGHGKSLYENLVNGILIIKHPFNKQTGRELKRITLSDLLPTILSICEIPVPDNISGSAFGNGPSPTVAEGYKPSLGHHKIIYDGKYKFMQYDKRKTPELYDLENDPLEQENLAEHMPEITLAMDEKLKAWEKIHVQRYTDSPGKTSPISKGILEDLKALGYIQ